MRAVNHYIVVKNIIAKERRKEYTARTFDKVVRELNTITTMSDLENWGNTFAQEYVRDIPEFRDELKQEYKRKLSELDNT